MNPVTYGVLAAREWGQTLRPRIQLLESTIYPDWVKAHMRLLQTRMVLLPLEPHPIVNPFDGIPLSIQPGGQIVIGKIAVKRAPSRDKRLPGKGQHQEQKQQRFCPAIAESFGLCQPGAPRGPEKKT